MKKIISLFQRNYEGDRLVRDEIVPGAEWVIAREGRPTEKYDGSCCLIRGGQLLKRYDAKKGKIAPPNWEAAQEPDPITGHHPGWVPISERPEDKWFMAAWQNSALAIEGEATVEAVGPHFQGNPYKLEADVLWKHGSKTVPWDEPITFGAIKKFLSSHAIEGIVWWHSDGRMVKIKARDFGIRWPR